MKSATSSAVNELERLLSLRLFDRAGKRLLLNDSGRALLPRALALLDGAAGIEQMAGLGVDRIMIPAFFFAGPDGLDRLSEFGERVMPLTRG